MRRITLALTLLVSLASIASARIWTDATGSKKVDAEYAGMEEGQVKLQFTRTGQVVLVTLGALSPQDQEFVQQQMAAAEAAQSLVENGPPDRFDQGVMDDPTNPSVYANRGMARSNRKDYDGAIKDFSKAIELDPEDSYAYNGRGLALHKKGDLIAAHRDFNEAIRRNPELPSAYRNRGENLYRLALDPKQSVPELDEAIEKWEQYWNHARRDNLKSTPWQPLNATKGDVSRPAALMQMAKVDREYAERLEHVGWDGGWGGQGGHAHGGGHGPGCTCPVCSGTACPHCGGAGCPACGGGKPAPGLGVYPPQCMHGETVTLVANASQLAQGMPAEAKPGQKADAARGPKPSVESVDFYRDVDGNGLFSADGDQFLAADGNGSDGFSVEVSTSAFPPGPQSYFAVPRGAPGSGSGATPEEMMAAATALEEAAKVQQGICQECESGSQQGLSEDQSKGVAGNQDKVNEQAEKAAEKVAEACPEIGDLLEEAAKPMKAVRNLMNTAQKRPGEACKEDAGKAAEKAGEAADKLAQAASQLREAAEAAKASQASNPGQAPANAASGRPTSGANEILAAAPIGPRGSGGPGGGPGDGSGDDQPDINISRDIVIQEDLANEDRDVVIERALEYVDDRNYDRAVEAYDVLLEDDPDDVALLRDRAATQLLRGGYDHAVRDYDRLLSIKEEPDADLYYNRGCAHLAAGRLEAALSDFTKSISLNETWSLAYNNRGATYARTGDYKKAIEDFTEAIRLEPGNRLAYRNRALAYKKLGEMRKAEADYAFVVKLAQDAAGTPAP